MKAEVSYDIFNTTYLVDVFREELREKGNPQNVIPLQGLSYSEQGYVIPYHVAMNRMATAQEIKRNEHQIALLPQLSSIDPTGMAKRTGLKTGQVYGKSDFILLQNPLSLLQRKMNFLPKIQIAGRQYVADIDKLEFTSNDFDQPLVLKFTPHPDHLRDETFCCSGYLHLGTRKLVEFDQNIKQIPEYVIFFRLPPLSEIDPYLWAQKNHIDITHWLRWHPIKTDLKAQVLPIEQSPVALRAAINRRKEQTPKEDLGNKQRKRKRLH